MDPSPDMSPAAKGDLVKTPLAHLIVFIAERKLHGSLLLHGDDGSTTTVYFVTGAPAKVQTSYSGTHLGRILLQLGFIDDETLRTTLIEREQTGTLHGQLLTSMGAIDEAQLVAGLREQMMRRLLKVFEKLGELTTYSFYADVNLLSDWGGPEVTPIDPLRVMWEGMHLRPNDPSIDPTLARLGSVAVGINQKADLRRFGFGPPEMKVIELLGVRPMSLAQVFDLSVMPIRQLKLLMYALLISKSIEVVPVQTSASPSRDRQVTKPDSPAVPRARLRPPDEPPASSRNGVPMARVKLKKSAVSAAAARSLPIEPPCNPEREDIVARATEIESEDYFQVLGISRDAPADVARSAYFALAKKWHPDRLPSELADVRDHAAKVFAKISDAFQTLSDGERRVQYLEMLERGASDDDEQAKVQQVIEATIEYQKAEVYLRKRELDKALKSAQRAYEGDPEQAHHVALYAWVLAQQPEAQQNKLFDQSLSMLDQAIKLHDRCEQAFLYRAMLNKQLGKARAALKDFRVVADINPRNIDAIREVRLASMRGSVPDDTPPHKGEDAKSGSSGGKPINWGKDSVGDIFGKLFKKK
jgi:curved DNA-binding protein CbpA